MERIKHQNDLWPYVSAFDPIQLAWMVKQMVCYNASPLALLRPHPTRPDGEGDRRRCTVGKDLIHHPGKP
ncbi:MAG: hypothetical protein ACREHD_21790, partial [Pirellulales bacterium]